MQPFFKEHFTYDVETGVLRWRKQRRRVKIGDVAGTTHHTGCLVVKLYGTQFLVHRVIWSMQYGDPVPRYLTHKDGDRTNNRLNNIVEDNMLTDAESKQLADKLRRYGVIK